MIQDLDGADPSRDVGPVGVVCAVLAAGAIAAYAALASASPTVSTTEPASAAPTPSAAPLFVLTSPRFDLSTVVFDRQGNVVRARCFDVFRTGDAEAPVTVRASSVVSAAPPQAAQPWTVVPLDAGHERMAYLCVEVPPIDLELLPK